MCHTHGFGHGQCAVAFLFFFNCPTTLPQSQKKWKIAPYCGWVLHKQLATNMKDSLNAAKGSRFHYSALT